MKTLLLLVISIFLFGCANTQRGFTGPGSPSGSGRAARAYQSATVTELASLPHNSKVILTGNIVSASGRGYYTFRDNTGEVIIEIERRHWGRLSIGPNDRIEIHAELERKRDGRIEVESKRRIRTI